MVFAAAIGGLVGARLLFIIEEWQGFLAAPLNYIFTGAGFTWYGGFFGGALAASWVVRKNKIPWLAGVDIGAPALALAYGVGRVGCHFAGDGDWGAVTDDSVGRGLHQGDCRLGQSLHRCSLCAGRAGPSDAHL